MLFCDTLELWLEDIHLHIEKTRLKVVHSSVEAYLTWGVAQQAPVGICMLVLANVILFLRPCFGTLLYACESQQGCSCLVHPHACSSLQDGKICPFQSLGICGLTYVCYVVKPADQETDHQPGCETRLQVVATKELWQIGPGACATACRPAGEDDDARPGAAD